MSILASTLLEIELGYIILGGLLLIIVKRDGLKTAFIVWVGTILIMPIFIYFS